MSSLRTVQRSHTILLSLLLAIVKHNNILERGGGRLNYCVLTLIMVIHDDMVKLTLTFELKKV